mmetsp:Transcript_20173/g.30333  ORF Transcript_20173/g.30333 Transcript_20173/m.30333 type:complete len:320 (+) Transcript_20173:1194-2153(+)
METSFSFLLTQLTHLQLFSNDPREHRLLQDDGRDPQGVNVFEAGFMISFFFWWNLVSSIMLLRPIFTFFRKGQFRTDCVLLLCPHWLIGAIFPALMGNSVAGDGGGILFSVMSLAAPYALSFIYILTHPENVADDEICCTLPCCMPRSEEETSADDIEAPPAANTGTTLPSSTNNEQSPLEELLIIKRVIETEKGRGKTTSKTTSYGAGASFRTKHPKTDIYPSIGTQPSTNGYSSYRSSFVQSRFFTREPNKSMEDQNEDITNRSKRLCSICLEDFEVDQLIGWSRNPNCHHVFHKDCIIEWLSTHNDCPVCRNVYTK